MLPLNDIVMQWFTEKRTGPRGTERIKEASRLQRLIFHFQLIYRAPGNIHARTMQNREKKARGSTIRGGEKAKLEIKIR